MLVDAYRLTIDSAHNPKGPDGQGRNRLGINPMDPFDRCAMRPKSKAAAMDLLRGMLSATMPTAFDLCDGNGCASCPRATKGREPWNPLWIIREDDQGRPWLLSVGRGFESFGYGYKSWAALIQCTEVPMLIRDKDQHGLFYRAA